MFANGICCKAFSNFTTDLQMMKIEKGSECHDWHKTYHQQSIFTGCMFVVNAKFVVHVFEFEQEVELKNYMEQVNRRKVRN